MSQVTKNTVTFRNIRNEYLFISDHSYDYNCTHLVLTDRNGEILRSYKLPLSLNICVNAMFKAGWQKVDF